MSKIKNLKLKNPYFLAPMESINDIAFRILCKKAGTGLVYTGMINPLTKQKLNLEDKPAIQLFSKDGKGISEFIKKHDKEASLWDFNLGCPAKTAKKNCFGIFMNNKLELIDRILKEMKQATKKPITIKIRISNQTEKIIKIAEKYCDAISIHPRTQAQGYSGKPDITFVDRIKSKTSLPIIYSGNVNEKNAHEFLKKFDFMMIGREAIGNPDIFARLTDSKKQFSFHDYLKLARRYKLPFSQIKNQAMNFTKGLKNAKKMRASLIKARTLEEIEKVYGSTANMTSP